MFEDRIRYYEKKCPNGVSADYHVLSGAPRLADVKIQRRSTVFRTRLLAIWRFFEIICFLGSETFCIPWWDPLRPLFSARERGTFPEALGPLR